MQFARPEWLWLFIVVALVGLRAASGAAQRVRDWAALGLPGRPSGERSVAWVGAAALLSLALSRPQWGSGDGPPSSPGRDVVLAIDVSRSMGARDAVPDRLGVAVESAKSFVAALGRSSGDRLAVVAFAGRGVRLCPLTESLEGVLETLEDLRPGIIQPGGTDLGEALDAAREAFDDQEHAGGRTVVLFSDGEDHPGHWRAALDQALAEQIVVHVVAVGDPDRGHPVPRGSDGPLEYQGEPVMSRRVDGALEAIAGETGGAFIPLGLAVADLGRLYRTKIEPIAASRHGTRLDGRRAERFGLFILSGYALMVMGCRPASLRPAALGGRKWFALLAVAALAGSDPQNLPSDPVESGLQQFKAGRLGDALASFGRAIRAAPKEAVPRYNAAATLFRLGRFDEAEFRYREARDLAGLSLRTKVDYALGNTSLARGDFAWAIRHYDDCLASLAPGRDLDRVRKDAALNKRYTEEQADLTRQATPDGVPGDESSRDRRDEKPGEREPDDSDPQGTSPDPGNGKGGAIPDSADAAGRRGSGGAGGEAHAPLSPESPEYLLAKAVEAVRLARAGRLRVPEPAGHPEGGKDW